MRAAIYARYSTELQREASIQDQVRICRRLIEGQDWTEVAVYSDMAISGANHQRPGYQRLLADLRDCDVDVVVAESLDRISRDQEHIAGFHKQMSFRNVRIVTVGEGDVSELHIGLKGTMSALFLKDLALKTHRGLEGRVRQGRSAGGISFGYRVRRQLMQDGSLSSGEREIDPSESAVVRRILRDYAGGLSARRIAVDLNEEGIPAPRSGKGPGTWSFSTISGNWKRGTGILNNELYIGRLVWNRQHFMKDPQTGRRQARRNPPEAWVIEDVPELRIVEDDLWEAVKERQGAIRSEVLADDRPNGFGRARRPTYLFSGLLKCGCCGAGYTLVNRTKYGCSASRNRGTCSNRKLIARQEVEERVLSGLRERLLHPDLIAEFVAEYQREWNRLHRDETAARMLAERELANVKRKINQIIDAIENGMFHPTMKDRMTDLEDRKSALQHRLDALKPKENLVRLHPGLAEVYRRKVAELAAALNIEGTRMEAGDILRSLIDEIRLHPEDGGHAIEIVGDLAGILSLCEAETKTPRRGNAGASDSLVAGARLGHCLPMVASALSLNALGYTHPAG